VKLAVCLRKPTGMVCGSGLFVAGLIFQGVANVSHR
jgi:hypothetical protein